MFAMSSFREMKHAVLAALVLAGGAAQGGVPEDALAVLQKHCAKCHAPPANKSGFGYVLEPERLLQKEQVVAGNPDASPLYQRMLSGEMPPPGEEPNGRPSGDELDLVAAWIRAGAPSVATPVTTLPPRERFPLLAEMAAVRDHLRTLDPEDRPFWRYFTLRNLYNTPQRTDAEIDYCRAALGKALNSLSWKQRMVVPVRLDVAGIVYGIDIRDMSWTTDYWREILSHYPYGLKHDLLPDDREMNQCASEAYEMCETSVPVIRADWFITRALRPPLYHVLLDIPQTDAELEKRLGVNANENILQGRVARKGMEKSGISDQHRMIERHDATNGYYWKSYDFKPTAEFGDLTTHPLGPRFEGNPYERHAFTHDGGELIFRLPNGLQGYMLIDGKGQRINAGPTDVVADEGKVSGNVEIINGISCIACHNQGMMVGEEDVVREGTALGGESLRFLKKIYPPKERMEAYIEEDAQFFREAVVRAMGGMADHDAALKTPDGRVIEPITNLAKGYSLFSLGAIDLSAELDIDDPQKLLTITQVDDRFRRIGLGPIATGKGKVKRILWENTGQGADQQFSPYQQAASYLKLGVPHMVQRRAP